MQKLTPKKRVLFVRRLTPVLLAVFGVFSFALTFAHSPKLAYADTSSTINFQARLQSRAGAIVPDGDYNVEFKLYNSDVSVATSQGSCASDTTHCLWVETRTSTNKVHVVNGYLTVQLGSVNPFGTNISWSQNLWLTMNIGGTSTPSWDGEMDPRLPLTAVPYAFTAGSAAQLEKTSDGFTSTLNIQAPTGGDQTFQIQNQGAAGTYNILTAPNGQDGYVKLQSGSVTQQLGSLSVDGTITAANAVLGNGGLTLGSGDISLTNGSITLGGTGVTDFRTPGSAGDGSNGSNIHTKINIPIFDPGSFGQIIAMGLPSSAQSSSRAISILDARTGAHQPSISVFSPDENNVFGFSWDGSNSLPLIKSSTSKIGFSTSGSMPVYIDNSGSAAVLQVGIAGPSGKDGALVLSNATTNAQVSIEASNATSSYTIQLPASYGTAGQCLKLSGVSGSVETLTHYDCFLQGGNSFGTAANLGTADSNALNLITNGVTQATVAVGGATTFKNSSDSANAFAVQDHLGNSILNVDTQNAHVGIGTGTPSRPLDIVTNTSLTNAPSIKLEQQGTGDTSIEFKDANGKSFFVGQDQSSGSTFKIASSTSAATPFIVGNTTGGSVQGGWQGSALARQVTTGGTGGTVSTIDVYIGTVDATDPEVRVALYADNSGAPGALIAGTTVGQTLIANSMNAIPLSATVNASTSYWIVVTPKGNSTQFKYNFCSGCAGANEEYAMTFSDPWANPLGSPYGSSNANDWMFSMTVVPVGTVDSFAGTDLFSLTDQGALTLQNSADSGAAFQIQNASGSSMLTVDTSGGNVNLGTDVNLILSGSGAHISNPQGQTNGEAFGADATVSGANGTAVGNGAVAVGNAVSIGYQAGASSGGFGGPVSIGQGANAGSWGVAIGQGAANGGNHNIALGNSSNAVGDNAIALGDSSVANQNSIVIGTGASSGGNNRIVLGRDATATADDQLVIGSGTAGIDHVIIGNGVTSATPVGFTLQATSTTTGTTDVAGGSVTIAGGQGTGTGNGGDINFQIAKSGTTGSSQNSLSTVASISGANGSAVFQNSANSTTAFQVQNASGASMFNVNTSAQVVTIGPSGGDTTGTLLVLGTKTNAGDPTEVDGAMYYNSNMGTFRCGQGTIWVSCMGGLLTGSTGLSSTVTNTTTETALGTTYSVPANYCANGRTLRLTAYGIYHSGNGADLTVRIKLGTTTLSTTTAYSSLSAHATDTPWTMNFMIICPGAPGASPTITGQGLLTVGGETNMPLPYTATTSTDTTASQTLSMTAQWGFASTNDVYTLNSFVLESLGP